MYDDFKLKVDNTAQRQPRHHSLPTPDSELEALLIELSRSPTERIEYVCSLRPKIRFWHRQCDFLWIDLQEKKHSNYVMGLIMRGF